MCSGTRENNKIEVQTVLLDTLYLMTGTNWGGDQEAELYVWPLSSRSRISDNFVHSLYNNIQGVFDILRTASNTGQGSDIKISRLAE